MNNVIVITGPTASGKTGLSIELAKRINGEIVSADSMQVYKGMDIGTAKPTKEEMQGIRHFLIDEVSPFCEFSVAKYKELATGYIKDILSRGKIPLVVGGTGLYINSLIYNIQFSETVIDAELRASLNRLAREKGNEYLHKMLQEIDPESAEKIHVNDLKRIIRAIEVFRHTNKTISYHRKISKKEPPEFNYILFGLRMDREKLYSRINDRVDAMMEKGLVEEVKKLVESGLSIKSTAMQGLGYKEVYWYLKGWTTLEETVNLLKRDTRRYAKRQMTWFNAIKDLIWIDMDKYLNYMEIIEIINNYIARYGIFL